MARVNNTDFAVAQQLAALAHDRYEVGIALPPRGAEGDSRMMIRRWTAAEVEKSLGFLKAQNLKGAHIYIRPAGHHAYSLVDDVSLAKIAAMKAAGLGPALVVESSPNNYQAWIAHGQTLDPATSTAVAKELARRFEGDPSSADWRHFGRLAGFTNRKPKYEKEGRFPFVKVTEAEGRLAPASAELVRQVQADLAREQAEERRRREAYKERTPDPNKGLRKSIDDFRSSPAYGGDDHRADLAYAIYAVSHQLPMADIEAALRSRDLSHKGNAKRQTEYIERTIKKAQDQARGLSR